MRDRRFQLVVVPVALTLVLVALTAADPAAVPTDPHDRVAYHLRAVDELSKHFETVLGTDCPRFESRTAWKQYFDDEVERVVLLMAHLEQAWIEAKRSPEKELRHNAKAPRKRVDDARALIDKLQQCAGDNGTSFSPFGVWHRIEREVPQRQAEIALPLPSPDAQTPGASEPSGSRQP